MAVASIRAAPQIMMGCQERHDVQILTSSRLQCYGSINDDWVLNAIMHLNVQWLPGITFNFGSVARYGSINNDWVLNAPCI